MSTLTPTKSPVSRSTSSHTLFRSKVRGIFRFNRSSRSLGSLSSSLRRRKRSSRLALSSAFFRFMCRLCRFSLFPTLNEDEICADGLDLPEPILNMGFGGVISRTELYSVFLKWRLENYIPSCVFLCKNLPSMYVAGRADDLHAASDFGFSKLNAATLPKFPVFSLYAPPLCTLPSSIEISDILTANCAHTRIYHNQLLWEISATSI